MGQAGSVKGEAILGCCGMIVLQVLSVSVTQLTV